MGVDKPTDSMGRMGSHNQSVLLPYGIELMLQLCVLQNLYMLSDEGTMVGMIDSRVFSDFVRWIPAIRHSLQ